MPGIKNMQEHARTRVRTIKKNKRVDAVSLIPCFPMQIFSKCIFSPNFAMNGVINCKLASS
ncbi:hypothetical protein DXT88_12215 [Herbaspirillum lusitanum]|nr:hypothetical protein [Herbaspirillum lusitanum]